MKNLLSFLFEYLLHASTWKGLFSFLASAGILQMSDTTEGKATAAALAVIGFIQVFIDDYNVNKRDN